MLVYRRVSIKAEKTYLHGLAHRRKAMGPMGPMGWLGWHVAHGDWYFVSVRCGH